MANKNILTTQAKTVQVEEVYYAPSVIIPPETTANETSYCFLSKIDPWADDDNPPQPTGDVNYIKQTFKNMFVAKRIYTSDISPVIQRVNWESNIAYDYYSDSIYMVGKDSNGQNLYNFYVKNKYDQVFKCLWNNNGGLSLDEPYFEPGSYNTSGIFQGPTDGYKWKFMYAIDLGSKVKFLDDTWMPVMVGRNTPNPAYDARTGVAPTAGAGAIEVINLINNGSGYDSANAPITVTITGDGTSASATASSNAAGYITDITVTNAGKDYTYANVSITSTTGSGAVSIAPTSPIGGHGFDPISELGCNHVMITSEFNSSEGNVIPTDIDFHQLGLLVNPIAYTNTSVKATGGIYRTTTDVVVAAGFGSFTADEIVFQGTSLEAATFTARVLTFNTSTNVIYLINTVGTITTNAPIIGDTSKTTRTLLSSTSGELVPFSGHITYIENRSSIQRSVDGIEQFRFVLGY